MDLVNSAAHKFDEDAKGNSACPRSTMWVTKMIEGVFPLRTDLYDPQDRRKPCQLPRMRVLKKEYYEESNYACFYIREGQFLRYLSKTPLYKTQYGYIVDTDKTLNQESNFFAKTSQYAGNFDL